VKPYIAAMVAALIITPAYAGEGGSKREFKDLREGVIRQLSPEGRYCQECHRKRPIVKPRPPVKPPAPVPLPASALLFAAGMAGVAYVSHRKGKRVWKG